MAWSDDVYSRMVAWLKILLPLAALAILSTLFLLSRSIDPTTTIPVTTIDLRERAASEQITNPEFSGATTDGDLIAFWAATARPDPQNPSRATALALRARINLVTGGEIAFTADGGIVDEQSDRVELVGNVVMTSSTGYRVTTDKLITGMRHIHAETPGPIKGVGPPGRFSAGRMLLTADKATGGAKLLFTDGVKLLYDPSETKD